MCGIAGIYDLANKRISGLSNKLRVCNKLQAHRGPDDVNIWTHKSEKVGMGHVRLSIIDIAGGSQPMIGRNKNCIVFNGEVYNFLELQKELGKETFKTKSDTEVILESYNKWGEDCVKHFRGMFAFTLWDEKEQTLFCARDHFGIKPFYYTIINNQFYFASEIKALLPFVKSIETDKDAFKEYLSFQFVLGEKTLFKGIKQLQSGCLLTIKNGIASIRKYWEPHHNLDFNHTEKYFEEKLQGVLEESVSLHTRSDVPIGGYLSGGLDSSAVCALANKYSNREFMAFTGKFAEGGDFDESRYAKIVADREHFNLESLLIKSDDFKDNIRKVIYHMDYPAAGPGAFSQYMISSRAAKDRKVLLGGQGGDEIFGGYTRYLIAYFEQCIKAAIDGTLDSGNFIVTYESIIPNLKSIKKYKPLLKRFWKKGLFEDVDKRYLALIDRTPFLTNEVNWENFNDYSVYDTFRDVFYGNNVNKESYLDLMTNFDFKTLLPALLHVEDRVSMAHGIESRTPLLDLPYVELASTIPSNIKFKDGNMKHVFKSSIKKYIPSEIINREDKMGFPTPFTIWSNGELNGFVMDILSSQTAKERSLINNRNVLESISREESFGRGLWGFLSLELWQQEFHDKECEFKKLLE